ncbi:MAG TPA: hypothetical protein VMA95_15310 [Streptosporangiaceae bacterium]|nr:hypothetical protein [Streptosporangiaceae bacterium]
MAAHRPKGARTKGIGVGAVLAVLIVLGVLALIGRSNDENQKPPPPAIGVGCIVRGHDGFDVPLTAGQAGIAATIAAVADDRALPVRAVTIAYATALQESDLENLPYGDRDSVGVFQQRPSQGWGTRAELLDPVYATTKFFAALAEIPNYRHLPIYRAAQDVQRSADGYAYSQYSVQGAVMAAGFAGWQARSIYCWYGSGVGKRANLAATDKDLTTAFGALSIEHVGDPVTAVRVRTHAAGWAVATWLVTHAGDYGIKTVRFSGYEWTAANGQHGWVKARRNRHWPAGKLTVAFG